MVIAKVIVHATSLEVAWCQKIPKGIVGAKVEIEYADEAWSVLNRTVVFQSTVTKDTLQCGTVVTIPSEVVASAGATLFMGLYGTDADNTIAIPTVWVALGIIQGATDPSGDASTNPTLPVWAQMERRFEKLMHLADNPQETIAPSNWAAAENEPGYIQNRTHWAEKTDGIIFDGNMAGKEAVLMDTDTYMVKVSDAILFADDIIGSTITLFMDGDEPEEITENITESDIYDLSSEGIPAIAVSSAVICLQEDFSMDGISATAGVYFVCVSVDGASMAYVKHMSGLSGCGEIIHKLDNKYLNLGWFPEYRYGTEVLLAESTQYFNGKSCQQDFSFLLQAGKRYDVSWDGVNYDCIAKTEMSGFWGVIYIGNRSLQSSSYEDTGEPFCIISGIIANVLLRTEIYASGDATEHKVAVSITDLIANRIPMDFMPQGYTMPTDLGKSQMVNTELLNAYAAFQKGAPVYIQYNNSLYRVLSLFCDMIDSMSDHICMTDGTKIMLWHRNQGWTEFSQKGFVIATGDYSQYQNNVRQGKKYRFTVDENGTLVPEDVTGIML